MAMSGRKIIFAASIVILITLLAQSSYAEPYIAVREGMKCSQCHVNRTGGGMRNSFGVTYSQSTLPGWEFAKLKDLPYFDPNLNDYVSIGGVLGVQNVTTLLGEENSFGDDVENTFTFEHADIFLEVRLLGPYLSLYFDEALVPTAVNREAFGLLQNLPWNAWVKAGAFFVPYGIRVADDEAFIRSILGYTMMTPDMGIEVGAEPGPFTFVLSYTNGTAGGPDNNLDKQVTLMAVLVKKHFRVGFDGAFNDMLSVKRYSAGPIVGLSFWKLAFLGEFDVLEDTDKPLHEITNRYIAFGELDFLARKGFNIKFSWDWFDPDIDTDSDEMQRFSFGIEPFITRFLQLRAFYHYEDSIPHRLGEDQQEIMLEAHLFF